MGESETVDAAAPPLDLYYWPTPNGWKVTIMLAECGLPYRLLPVDITRGEQFQPEFLAISPNNRMPALVDREPPGGKEGDAPLTLFESGAILQYLADRVGRFCPPPSDVRGRAEVSQWLFWQMGGLGPMAGQCHHFRVYAPEPIPYAIERYTREVGRLYGVMDRRLADRPYLAGEYSIADMACWPWVLPHKRQGQDLSQYPHLQRWFREVGARPAVREGQRVGAELPTRRPEELDDDARRTLFGEAAVPKRGD